MKRSAGKSGNILKGAPSGLVISLTIHAAAFFLAGLLVIFNVVQKEEKKFIPPKPVDRPKMKLKKPKVNVKKTAKPKSTTRIVTNIRKGSMPVIELPEIGSLGGGFGGGDFGGFDLLSDLGEITVLGTAQSIGNDLVGTFYDLNRRRSGSEYELSDAAYLSELVDFVRGGWRLSRLNKYYRSPKKLYATTIAVPPMASTLAPSAFNEPDAKGRTWVAHYKGKLVHHDGIRFRFVGNSDDVLVVRVDGETVLDGCRGGPQVDLNWLPDSADHLKWYMAHDYCGVGHLIELEPGVPKELEIIIGEKPGGVFNAILCVMEEGVTYPKNRFGAPILPIFKTSKISRTLQDLIYRGMPPNEIDVINGPIFNDYGASTSEGAAVVLEPLEPEPQPSAPVSRMRMWTSADGKMLEGEYLTTIGSDVILKTIKGKSLKIPIKLLCAEDMTYISLNTPPEFKLDVGKKIRQKRLKWDEAGAIRMNEYTFNIKVKSSETSYKHRLRVKYWIIGSEIGGSQYILLDKGRSSFVPAEQPDGEYAFSGAPMILYDWVLGHIYKQRRGEQYEGFLITVTDERGEMIAYRSTASWLFKNMDKLSELALGSYMDNTCTRTWPTPLKAPR